MVCQPVRGDNPRALASGLSKVQADKPCSILLVAQYRVYTLRIKCIYLVLKIFVSGKCAIMLEIN